MIDIDEFVILKILKNIIIEKNAMLIQSCLFILFVVSWKSYLANYRLKFLRLTFVYKRI